MSTKASIKIPVMFAFDKGCNESNVFPHSVQMPANRWVKCLIRCSNSFGLPTDHLILHQVIFLISPNASPHVGKTRRRWSNWFGFPAAYILDCSPNLSYYHFTLIHCVVNEVGGKRIQLCTQMTGSETF